MSDLNRRPPGHKNHDYTLGSEAFIWDSANGMRNLRELLVSEGDDLTGWRLTWAYGISGDGSTIVGFGTNPEGSSEAWVARLKSVPEPSTLILTIVVALGLLCGRLVMPPGL